MSSNLGYATRVGHAQISGMAKKHLLGKPTVIYGQALGVAASLYEIGAVLGAVHRDRLMAFADAFIGLRGEIANAREYLGLQVERELSSVGEDASFSAAAMANEARRISFPEPFENLLLRRGDTKTAVEDALYMVSHASLHGLALGAIEPESTRRRFDASYEPMDPAEYAAARQAGLELTQPESTTWEQHAAFCDDNFREFCQDHRPDLYASLYG